MVESALMALGEIAKKAAETKLAQSAMAKKIIKNVSKTAVLEKTTTAIEKVKETEALIEEIASKLLSGECSVKDLFMFLDAHKEISLNDIVGKMVEQVFSNPDLLVKIIETNPAFKEQAEKIKNAIKIISDPTKSALEKKNASMYIDSFKGRLLEAVMKDVLSKIGLSVESSQKLIAGAEGLTRPDIIAKNMTNYTYKLFGQTIKPGDILSIECKCGGKNYLESELKTHIPKQLAGQPGKRVLLTTSDIKDGLDALLNDVLKKYDATLFDIGLSADVIRHVIMEVLKA